MRYEFCLIKKDGFSPLMSCTEEHTSEGDAIAEILTRASQWARTDDDIVGFRTFVDMSTPWTYRYLNGVWNYSPLHPARTSAASASPK